MLGSARAGFFTNSLGYLAVKNTTKGVNILNYVHPAGRTGKLFVSPASPKTPPPRSILH